MLKNKNVSCMVLGLIFIFQTFCLSNAFAQTDSSGLVTSRLSGADRYETSLDIVRNGWTHASNVIIATGLNFSDALSASALSKSKDAPIILTRPDSLSQDAIDELKNLGTTNAYIIGGSEVISPSIETQLKGLGIGIARLGGMNRYDTSEKIAEQIGVNNGIAVATGENFPDALSIASVASIKSMPILLSPKSGLDGNVENFLNGKNIPVSYIIGGEDVLNPSLDQSLPNSKRLNGSTRYETNIAINTEFQANLNFDTVYLAAGRNFPDALCGSALAAKNNAPIFLTDQGSISPETLDFMKSKNVKHVVILGGTAAVSQTVENQISADLTVKVSSVSLNKTSETLRVGDTDTLAATVSPSAATNQAVSWSTSDSSVASVDSNGKITAVSVGTATITATTADGNYEAACPVTVNPSVINVTSISLNKTSDILNVGDTETLTATVSPSTATDPSVTWSTSDPSIATVDSNGKVTVETAGTATITVTTTDGNYTASCVITANSVSVSSLVLDKTTDTLKVGDTDALIATISPSNATNQALNWSTSDPGIAAVDNYGRVTGKSVGVSTITVTSVDGNYTASCEVTVNPVNVSSISLNKTTDTLIVGGSEKLIATVFPANATNKNINWASSDPTVATVDSNGKVTAVSEGTATITSTTEDGDYSTALSLTVQALKIASINDINSSVLQGDNFSLPSMVSVNMNNGTQEYRTVAWDSSSVDTLSAGIKTYQGTVDGYDGKVNLNLNVISLQSYLFLSGTSAVVAGSSISSYGITLTNYLTRIVNIDKVEIYNNGKLSSTYTKDTLAANNIPTSINSYLQWSISFSFYGLGISTTNSYIIVYVNNNGYDIPCVYQMKT